MMRLLSAPAIARLVPSSTARTALSLALLAALSPTAVAQQPVRASLYHRVEGQRIEAAIELRVDPGWHFYHTELGRPDSVGLPTTVKLGGEGIDWGDVSFPEPERHEQPGLGDGGADTWIWTHHGRVVLNASGSFTGEPPADLSAVVKGLVCEDGGQCQPMSFDLRSKGPGRDGLFPAPSEDEVAEPAADTAGELGPATGIDELKGRLWVRRDGERMLGVIRLELAEGWHLYNDDLGNPQSYSLPTVVEMRGEGVDWDEVVFPDAERYTDISGDWALVHHGTIELRVVGELEDDEPEGIGARITGQVCEVSCIPIDISFEPVGEGPDAAFAWASGDAGPEAVGRPTDSSTAAPSSGTRPGDASAGSAPAGSSSGEAAPPQKGGDSLLAFILLAIGGGLFALMMPCTYPMIPITISFFTKQAHARQGKVLSLSLLYGAGIVLIFILIGVVIGPVIIAFATHPVTNLVIGSLFLLFALVLFGLVDLQPPRFLMNAAGNASMHGGFAGVFLMGATLVVSSFTCTAPFVGSLLSFGAVEGGSIGKVALGMAVFGLTMAVPFVFLSLLPGKVQAMPRSGEWMNTLKVTLGFVEVAAALKFLSNADLVWGWGVLSRELFLLLWAAIFLLAAGYLLGWVRIKKEDESTSSPGRLVGAMIFLTLGAYCWHGYRGNQLDPLMTAIIPPYHSERVLGAASEEGGPGREIASRAIVEDDYDEAKALALANGQLLFINFTGVT